MERAAAALLPLAIILPSHFLPPIGMVACFVFSALGTAEGIYSIAKFVSGTAIRAPRTGTKAVLGTVVCEANFLTGIIMCVMLMGAAQTGAPALPKANYLYFSSGIMVGLCNYYSSVATGLVCSVVTMADAKDARLFFKLVVLEIIPASIGLLGFIIGIVLNSRVGAFV